MIYLSGDGRYSLAVVGESHYQDALIAIAGPYSEGGRSMRCYAVLDPEDDNPYDSNAVRVEIGGDTVGYIARDDAPFVRMILIGRYDRCYVDAVIRGGRPGTYYGVWLDLPLGSGSEIDTRVYPLYQGPDPLALPGIAAKPKVALVTRTPTFDWPDDVVSREVPVHERSGVTMPTERTPKWAWVVLVALIIALLGMLRLIT